MRDSLNRIVFYKHYINPDRSSEYEECIWYINTFNDVSQLASIEEQYWSPLFMDWKSATRTEYTYSKEGEVVEEFQYGLSPPDLPDWTLIGYQKNYYSMLGDILAPRLSVQTDTVELGNDILFTSSQDAQISLVPSGTFPGPVFSQSVIESSDVTGMVESSIQTSKITEPGQYLLYASNSDEIFSYADRIWITTNTTSLERYQYLEYRIYPTITGWNSYP